MKNSVYMILIVLLSLCSCNDSKDELKQIIDADKEFSKISAEKGIQEAFVKFAADSGIIIRANGAPIKGKEEIKEYMNDEKENSLTWKPVGGEISVSGDLGYTWGIYESKEKDSEGFQKISRGRYVTVWKKQSDDSWKWIMDIGNPDNTIRTQCEAFDPKKNPTEDLKNAIEKAIKENKRIILDIGGEWCIWCHRIDEFIYSSKIITSLLREKFIVLKINYSKENKNEEFLSQYPKVEGYPHFFVLEKNGTFLYSQNTGELEKGNSYDIEKFLNFLNKWALK